MKLEGRVALVTGASQGIGHACALALARKGRRAISRSWRNWSPRSRRREARRRPSSSLWTWPTKRR